MIHFTPEQYAVFVGGVRYIKKAIKKKGKGKSTRNRKQKKGTRRRQKGGDKLLRTIINGLFLAALFSAYLINTGTDMSLQTGIMAFSNASDLGVNADDVNNFMEGLAILIFYSSVNWEVAGQSRPSTCEQGQWTPNIPGLGRITSLSTDPVPGWSVDCPRNAHILGTVLSSVLAGMFMAWVGPCIISELVESTIGPPPADPTPTITSADPTPTITSSEQQPSSTGEDAAAAILAQAMNSITVDENDPLLQRQIVVSPERPRRLLTREQQAIMAARSDARRRRCNFRNPPFPSDSDRAYGRMDTESVRGQQLTTTNIQGEQLGNTLISLPQEVMLQLQQSGKLEAITKMISEAATQVVNSSQAQEWQGELQDTIFRVVNDSNGESRLQLQDELPELNCDTPIPAGSCPPISKSTKQKALADMSIPEYREKYGHLADGEKVDEEAREQEAQLQARLKKIRERMGTQPSSQKPGLRGEKFEGEDGRTNSWLRQGGAKRKQPRRRRKQNKKTKKKRPRNKKKSRKRR